MQLVITTQFMENYAAHNEDFEPGVSEDYWKFKGGDTYVVELGETFTYGESQPELEQMVEQLKKLIEHSYCSSREYVINWEVIGTNETAWEKWETPWTCTELLQNQSFRGCVRWLAKRYVPAESYWKEGIAGKHESYLMTAEGGREQYAHTFEMVEGIAA